MNSKQLSQAIVIFVAFLVVGILLFVVPLQIDLGQPETEAALQQTLPLLGSAMLGSGLTFFLIEMTRLEREKE